MPTEMWHELSANSGWHSRCVLRCGRQLPESACLRSTVGLVEVNDRCAGPATVDGRRPPCEANMPFTMLPCCRCLRDVQGVPKVIGIKSFFERLYLCNSVNVAMLFCLNVSVANGLSKTGLNVKIGQVVPK